MVVKGPEALVIDVNGEVLTKEILPLFAYGFSDSYHFSSISIGVLHAR